MEPFTHVLTSLALAGAGQKHLPRFSTAMLLVSGIAPDLDYASYLAGPDAFLRFHRTALHSLAGAAVTAGVVSLTFWALDRKWVPGGRRRQQTVPLGFAPAFAVCTIGAGGHVLLDLASGVGVQLLWPFRTHWSAWDLTANLDPWILILLVAGFLLPQLFRLVAEEVGERKKSGEGTAGSRAAVVTLMLLAAYLGTRADLRSRAVDMLLSSEYYGREPLSAKAFPSASDPFDWRGVVATDNTIEEIEVSLAPGSDFNSDRSLTHYKPEQSPALDAGEQTTEARRFLLYARFPLATVGRREDGYRFELRDLRFPAYDTSPSNIFLRVDFNSSLQILQSRFRFASSTNP